MTAARSVKQLNLQTIRGRFAITRLAPDTKVPEWANLGSFSSVTRTGSELSIVCRQENVPLDITSERDFMCLSVADTLDFSMVGILASLLDPLAEAGIPVMVISTFDTDYLMVKARDLKRCTHTLLRAGHRVIPGQDCEDG
jgi:hypothetical protein